MGKIADLTIQETMDIFQEAFFDTINKGRGVKVNDSTSTEEFTSDDERTDEDEHFNIITHNIREKEIRQKQAKEKAQQNANELMDQLEKEKRSKERKKSKKKRKKDKKKSSLEKRAGSESSEDELDHSSAFVANVAS